MIIERHDFTKPFQGHEEDVFLLAQTHDNDTRLIKVFLDGRQVSTNESSFLTRLQSALRPYEDRYTKEIKKYLSESDFVGAEAYLQARKESLPRETREVMKVYGFEEDQK